MKTTQDYLFTLETKGEECILFINIPFGSVCHPTRWKSISDLLASFLNREYFPNIVDIDLIKRRGFYPFSANERNMIYEFMDAWNHEEIEHTIKAIYGLDDIRVNKLKPNERHCVYLSMAQDLPLSIMHSRSTKTDSDHETALHDMYNLQPFMDRHIFVEAAASDGLVFQDLWEEIRREENVDKSMALYIAGCEIASTHALKLEKNFLVHFSTTSDLINWLLNYIIERNRYIYQCIECGRYFGSKREDATFCSTGCANKYNAAKGKFGTPEIDRTYKLIVSSFRDRLQSHETNGWHYIERGDDSFTPVNLSARKEAFHAEYRNRTKELKDLKRERNQDQFDIHTNELLAWLKEQLTFVRNLIPDRLS